MRDMSPAELDQWYDNQQWPCGHGSEYVPGSRGGIMRNVECPQCGMRISVVDPLSGFRWRIGQVLHEPDGYQRPQRPLWRRLWALVRKE